MKKILYVHPIINFELSMDNLLYKIFNYFWKKGRVKFRFYKRNKEIRGLELGLVIIDDFINLNN